MGSLLKLCRASLRKTNHLKLRGKLPTASWGCNARSAPRPALSVLRSRVAPHIRALLMHELPSKHCDTARCRARWPCQPRCGLACARRTFFLPPVPYAFFLRALRRTREKVRAAESLPQASRLAALREYEETRSLEVWVSVLKVFLIPMFSSVRRTACFGPNQGLVGVSSSVCACFWRTLPRRAPRRQTFAI